MNESQRAQLSITAVLALVIAVVALLLSAVPIINNFAFILALLAFVLGIIGLVGTKGGKRRGKGLAVASIVLAVVAGLIVLGSQKFYSDTLNTAGKEAQESFDTASGENTEEILGKEVDVTLGKFEAKEGQFTTDTVLPVRVTNKTGESKSYTIQIEAVDQSGNRITDDSVLASNLGANQSQDFKAFQYIEPDKLRALKTATFKIVSVSQY